MNTPKIGWRYRHLKRGTTYTVRGVTADFVRGREDGEAVFYVISSDPSEFGDGPYIEVVTKLEDCAFPKNIEFYVPVTFQISTPRADITADLVIYQGDKDGYFWIRPVAEFMAGRFERIKE